ncbi:hypothetical protein ACJMK2_023608 [Sinanodonta woodiana]|uniref:Protein kinase domain-containing protein n=1 Tax=Sinanodonta woodiana TaxID=1069815 RepID=A0ABD3T4Y3_SINWO
MKSKSMRFRWMSNLKRWVVNNMCCVIRKKNKRKERCNELESDTPDKCEIETSVLTNLNAYAEISRQDDSETEMAELKLEDLHRVTPLGSGGFGRVVLVQDKNNSSETYALKIISKQRIVEIGYQERILNEKNILAELKSDFIVRLYKTFKDDEYLYLLMELCLGGELSKLIYDVDNLNHTAAKFYTACIAEALIYMHSKGIVHSDLTTSNALLDSKGYIKLIDFGMASKVTSGQEAKLLHGTPDYMAPEVILNKGHNTAADLWSLGVIVYNMLAGWAPFADEDENYIQTYHNVLNGIDDVDFPDDIENMAEDLIRKLCRDDPAKRLAAHEIPTHGWFADFYWEDLKYRTMKPPFIPKITSAVDTRNFDAEDYTEESSYPNTDDVSRWDPEF